MATQRYQALNPGIYNCYLKIWKKDFADVITLRILRRGDNPGLSGWALNAITSVLKRKRQREITGSHRGEDTQMGEAMRPWRQTLERCLPSQGRPRPNRSWKGQGLYSPLDTRRGFSPTDVLILTSGIKNYERINVCCF